MKQVKFKALESNSILGGILLDDGKIICGCCGEVIEPDEPEFEIIKELSWTNISDEIIGE